MTRAATILFQGGMALLSGWAGWHFGISVDDASLAVALRQARLALPIPPPPPSGWNRRLSTPKPNSTNDELAARAFANPRAVVDEVMAEPPGPARNLRIVSVLRGWVARDPLAAAEWLAGLAPSETPELPFGEIEQVFFGAPYEAAAKGLLGFLSAKASSSLLARAAEGPRPLQSGGYGDMATRLHNLTGTFAAWSVCRPEQALAWARSLPNPEARRWLLGEAVGALAKNGAAEKAIAFFNEEPELQETGTVRFLGEGWAHADPAAALAWASELPNDGLRDDFLGTVLRTVSKGQAPAALAATAQVTDPAERLALRESLFSASRWNQSAISKWIESDPSLSDNERVEWRQKLERDDPILRFVNGPE